MKTRLNYHSPPILLSLIRKQRYLLYVSAHTLIKNKPVLSVREVRYDQQQKTEMTQSNYFDLEQKTFYVSTNEFKEKVENFQRRFHLMERGNKASIIRWLVLFLLVLVVAAVLGCALFIHKKKNENFVRTVENMEEEGRVKAPIFRKRSSWHAILLSKIKYKTIQPQGGEKSM